ncbi:hypothetical protein C8250_007770 [Streptomyces sp. So13.3]|uniref:hypothetical protein n=1 Tax=unclassified Streptomyces TaxID=2593676 RepID=UPI0011071101|nr:MULTISPECIES: hypothetical protein [unclassified Streptomyces]MCZ4103325.1 hypothetical protein [Streptomyces sp. H39-C1]QNA71812.1 hypothetical protein C8250_007770 [Streptomyces sp. So13.3]
MEPQDDQAAGEVLHGRGWRKAFTVTEMVDQWASLVRTVENGYEDLIDEYTNDLYSRNWLHEAWVLLPGHVLVTWNQRIQELDDCFRDATAFDDGQALSQFHRIGRFDPDAMWWWRRYPRILVGDLGHALRSAGAVDLSPSP